MTQSCILSQCHPDYDTILIAVQEFSAKCPQRKAIMVRRPAAPPRAPGRPPPLLCPTWTGLLPLLATFGGPSAATPLCWTAIRRVPGRGLDRLTPVRRTLRHGGWAAVGRRTSDR